MTDLAPGTTGQGADPGAVPGSTSASLSAPPPAAVAAPIAWLTDADEGTVGYVLNKGWQEPKQVLESYRNLEKLMGADRAGNTVILPKPDASPEEVGRFFDRLGRPADPAAYKIEVPKEGGDPEFAKGAAAKMHELGLSQKQGEALAAWWNEQAGGSMASAKQQAEQTFQADDQALRQQWGAAFTQELNKAQSAARALGVDEATIDNLQKSMGHKATMEFFNKIGNKIGESEFVSGQETRNFNAAMTPGQAIARIAELKADRNFVARYVSKDAEAVAEMARLHGFAYPE